MRKWDVVFAWVPDQPDHPKSVFKEEGVKAEEPHEAAMIVFRHKLNRSIPIGHSGDPKPQMTIVQFRAAIDFPRSKGGSEHYVEVPTDKGAYTFSILEHKEKTRSHTDLLQDIYDLFYLDSDENGKFYNPDKEVNGADFVEAVGEILAEYRPAPKETERG